MQPFNPALSYLSTQPEDLTQKIFNLNCNNFPQKNCFSANFDNFVPNWKKEISDVASKMFYSLFLNNREVLKKYSSAVEDCFSENCRDIDFKNLNSKEKNAANWINKNLPIPELRDIQEFFRFRKDDSREKALVVFADYHYKNVLNPARIPKDLDRFIERYDLKYVEVGKFDQICELVNRAQKVGDLAYILIVAHGRRDSFVVKEREFVTLNKDFSTCFSGLSPSGRIVLISSSVGAEDTITGCELNNIAKKIADDSKRTVIAPTGNVYPYYIEMLGENTNMLYHPKDSFSREFIDLFSENIFKIFRPSFTQCLATNDYDLFDQEVKASEAIRAELIAQSFLSASFQSALKDYLSLCSDDPREKLLFLAARDTDGYGNGFLNPKFIAASIAPLADWFDLKYRVITSVKQICQEVELSSKSGILANVIIQGTGNSIDGLLISAGKKERSLFLPTKQRKKAMEEKKAFINFPEQRINGNNQLFLSCFSKLKKDGRIIFLGSSLGKSFSSKKKSIAQRIANQVQRTVVASTIPVFPSGVKFQSFNPLTLSYHPPYSFWEKLTADCPKKESTAFKVHYFSSKGN